jgi:serine/threonine-protein kinase
MKIENALVDVAKGRTAWADKYSGDIAQAFALQERVSGAIAKALQLRLSVTRRTPRPEAVEAFLKGRHFARQATGAGFQKALACFEEATHLDPDYAAAFAALAETYVTLTTAWQALRALDTMPKAVTASQRALEIDPQLADAHVARGLVAMYCEWDLQTAERAFNEALRINPNNVEAHKRYSELLIWLDTRYDEALRHVRRAVTLDPVDLWAQVQVCWVHYFRRDFDAAIEQARQVVAFEPLYGYGHYALGCALLTAGHFEEANACFNRSIQLDGRTSHNVALSGIAYALIGRRDEALGCLAELDALDREGRSVAMWKLHVYAGLGDADNVIECLKVAVDQRNSSTLYMLTHPYTDFVRRDPRFEALLRQAGLGHLATRTFEPEWSPSRTSRT